MIFRISMICHSNQIHHKNHSSDGGLAFMCRGMVHDTPEKIKE